MYKATIHVWPYSTGAGADDDQKAAGVREQEFTFDAQSMTDALRLAKLVAAGIETNPRVWQAPIWKLERMH